IVRSAADAFGAVGLASSLFIAAAVLAMGLLLGLDPLVAQSFGAGRIDECHHWLIAGVWLGLLESLPMMAAIYAINASLSVWGLPAGVLVLARPYLHVLTWSIP